MLDYEMRQPVIIDIAPRGSTCRWCGKPAALLLTVPGDRYHNEGECFCQLCAEEFARTVADTLNREVTTEVALKALA